MKTLPSTSFQTNLDKEYAFATQSQEPFHLDNPNSGFNGDDEKIMSKNKGKNITENFIDIKNCASSSSMKNNEFGGNNITEKVKHLDEDDDLDCLENLENSLGQKNTTSNATNLFIAEKNVSISDDPVQIDEDIASSNVIKATAMKNNGDFSKNIIEDTKEDIFITSCQKTDPDFASNNINHGELKNYEKSVNWKG